MTVLLRYVMAVKKLEQHYKTNMRKWTFERVVGTIVAVLLPWFVCVVIAAIYLLLR